MELIKEYALTLKLANIKNHYREILNEARINDLSHVKVNIRM